MDYNLPENIKFCGDIVSSVQSLLLYTHAPSTLIALFVGGFVLYKTRNAVGALLFSISVTFGLWVSVDLLAWLWYDQNTLMITAWSLFGLIFAWLFFLVYWFTHRFITGTSLPPVAILAWTFLLLPVIIFTPTAENVSGVDIRDCVAVEGNAFVTYYYSLGALAIVSVLASVYLWLRSKTKDSAATRSAKYLAAVGAILFIGSFISTSAVASYLVDAGLVSDFGLEQYGVATMTVFIAILAYATVRYHAFNLKLLAAQALVFSLAILIAAEFLFVTNDINRILVGLTLGLAVIFGYLLVRSVKEEVRQRELIQKQEQELEVANKQQENLLHFISHEIKGYLTKSEAGFAGIVEGDYGTISETLKGMASSALSDVRKGVRTVMEILDASNLKKGTMGYKMQMFNLKASVTKVVNHLKPSAEEKHLAIVVDIADEQYMLWGDAEKIRQHVLRNLIDNAIKYTPNGTIKVKLEHKNGKLHFSVQDNGIGITPEDMQKLFTEGGHGTDSIKVNVHSTGYGLFIAKQVVEVHKGKIWAESDGQGKGSKFVVEFPTP